tara:strand:- start:381 stop:554 length:174 start_codon:yes stop_codon:yes gene_type:complete
MPKVKATTDIRIMGYPVFEKGKQYEISAETLDEHGYAFEKVKATKAKKDASKAAENK